MATVYALSDKDIQKQNRQSIIIGSVFKGRNNDLLIMIRGIWNKELKKELPAKYELTTGQTIHLAPAKETDEYKAKVAAGKKMPVFYAQVYVDEMKQA